MKENHAGLWMIAPPEKEPRPETAGLDKEEADFVSKYLGLADELLKEKAREQPAPPAAEQAPEAPASADPKAA